MGLAAINDPLGERLAFVATGHADISEKLANAQDEIAKIKGQLAQFRKHLGLDPETGDVLLRVHDVMRISAKFFGTTILEFQSPCRTLPLVRQRQMTAWLCRRVTGSSFPHIGRKLKKDHTTIIHAYRKIEELRQTDPDTRHELAELEALCNGTHKNDQA